VDYGLTGKSVIVTGASKGIGRAVAHAFLQEGANVALFARDEAELDRAVREGEQYAGTPLAVPGDVTKEEDRRRLVDATLGQFGSIDVLVNNAGGAGGFASFEELSLDDWRELFELNVYSVVGLTKLVLPHMRRAKSGRIINISSESAVQPDAEMPHYNASKAALNSITKSLSKAVGADGILVNAVAPAFIKTPALEALFEGIAGERKITLGEAEQWFLAQNRPNIVLKRAGTPEESAEVVLFLASAQASFVTGSVMRVDGGSVGTVSI
jgi:3-oxoacyl-[acyl-carrier protein] reductase